MTSSEANFKQDYQTHLKYLNGHENKVVIP